MSTSGRSNLFYWFVPTFNSVDLTELLSSLQLVQKQLTDIARLVGIVSLSKPIQRIIHVYVYDQYFNQTFFFLQVLVVFQNVCPVHLVWVIGTG